MINNLYEKIGEKPIGFGAQLNNKISSIYFYFPKWHETIQLENINLESNAVGTVKNRPIMLMGYNSENMMISSRNSNMTVVTVEGKNFSYTKFTIKKPDSSSF